MNYNSYFVYPEALGGFLELTSSNQYIFTDSTSNDLLLHTDYSNQNILIGTDSNNTSAIKITQAEILNNRNFYVGCNFGLGIRDYSERLVVGNGNSKFLSNIYVMNNVSIGTSNNTHMISFMGPSNSIEHGPNLTAYFSSVTPSNPVFQIMNWDRDDIQQNFDCYDVGCNILSTSSTGNFQIRKNLGRLQFMSCCNNNVGSNITNQLYPALTINSNSFIGISTRDPTNRLTMRAPASHALGPHSIYYIDSDSNYPLKQDLNWNHDDIASSYDAYFDGYNSNWISSSSTGNFKLHKQNGRFVFYSACNSVPGTNISTDWLPAMAINSNSYIGIGTRDPTNRFTMRAEDSNPLGPHLIYYVNTDSNYPVFQHLNWTHDEISQSFDAYFDGYSSNWISSSSTGNFQLRKKNGRLNFYSACNSAPGTIIDHDLYIAMSVNSNSYIGIGTENPTHKLTTRGFASHMLGPHSATYVSTDSNFPVRQSLNWEHDDITDSYDCYFDGYASNWISSSSTGNFHLRKNEGRFSIFNSCNAAPGDIINNNWFSAFSVNSNSYIGIGTRDPTHRLTMYGPTSDKLGPHQVICLNEDSNHPLRQNLNWSHDDIIDSFDCYFDPYTSNFVSSSGTGNFQLRKKDGRFMIFNSCNTMPGSNITNSLFTSFAINSNSFIGIGTQDPTHRMTTRGPASNILGAHNIAYLNEDSNNPVYQHLNWNHDKIFQSFDCHFDAYTSNWYSSHETGNFNINKENGRLNFYSACNVGAGSNINTDRYIAMSINSNSFFGLGTQDPTRRFTMRAEESNIQGPHVNFYIKGDSNFPLYEQLNWYHDDITQSYDASYDGSNWISSSSTGQFQIKKKNGRFMIFNSCNNNPGSNVRWFPAFTVNSNSYIGIGTSNPKHRFSIQGPSNNILGPHIATYLNDSNNPAFQIYTSNNDMISINFDSWWNGYNNISSSSNANFQIIKRNGKLIIQNAPFVRTGDIVDSSWYPAFTVNSNNYIGIRNSNPSFPLDVVGNSIFRDYIIVAGNIVPASNMQFDIGTPMNRFRDLYLSGASINMQDLVLRKDFFSGGLIVYDNTVNAPTRVWAKEFLVGDPANVFNSNVFLITASSNGIQLQNVTSNIPPQKFSQLNNMYIGEFNTGFGISNAEKTIQLVGDFEQNPIRNTFIDWSTNSVFRADISDLHGTTHHNNVNSWGHYFSTSNGFLPPVYYERDGFNDAPFVRFDSSNNSKLMLNSNININSYTNSGLTLTVLARFYEQITPGETILNLDNNGFKCKLYRDLTNPSILVFETNEVTLTSPIDTINQNEWAVYTIEEIEIDSLITMYKNGVSVVSSSITQINDMAFTNNNTSNYLGNGNVDIGGIFLFDRPLFVDELSNITQTLIDSGRQSMQVRTTAQSYPPTEFYQDISGWQTNSSIYGNAIYSKTINNTYYGNGEYRVWTNTQSSSPIYAFDLDNTTSWTSSSSHYTTNGLMTNPGASNVTYPTLYIQMPNKVILQQYVVGATVNNTSQTPTSWKIYGSTNNKIWTLLDVETGQTSWTAGLQRIYYTNTIEAYNYFKMEVTGNDSATVDYVSVGVLTFYGIEHMFYLDGTGVGLGTSFVKERLHVDGNALITSNLVIGKVNDDYLPTVKSYPPFAASSSSMNYNGGLYTFSCSSGTAINAFDSNNSTYWLGKANSYDSTGVYVDGTYSTGLVTASNGTYTRFGDWIQMALPDQINLEAYTITPRSSDSEITGPAIFYVGGSVDGTNWHYIDSQIVTWPSNSGPITFKVVDTNTIGSYSYFRLIINQLGTNGLTAVINNWQIYGGALETMTKESSLLQIKGDLKCTGNMNITSKYYKLYKNINLDIQELMQNNGNASLVDIWGELNQNDEQYRPIFYKNAGYKNAGYVRFNGRSLISTSGWLNMTESTNILPNEPNAGITITMLIRFNSANTTENVITFNTSSGILLSVSRVGTTNISFSILNNTVVTTNNPITRWEWFTLGIRYTKITQKYEIFVNNIQVASAYVNNTTINDTFYNNITIGGSSTNIDLGGLYLWNRSILDDFLVESSDILMQGQPQLHIEGKLRASSGFEGGLTIYGLGYGTTICTFPSSDLSRNITIVKNKLFGNGKYKASCSAYYQNNDLYDAYNAFQSLNNSLWKGQSGAFNATTGNYTGIASTLATNGTVYNGEWLQIDIPQESLALEYSITPDTSYSLNAPKVWYLFGSKNGIEWVLLNTQSTYTWTGTSLISFSITGNTSGYLSYRLVISGCNTNGVSASTVAIKRFYIYAKTRETTSMQDGTTIVFDKMGINTANPAASLHVAGFSVLSGLKIISTGASNVTLPSYTGSGSNGYGVIPSMWSANTTGVYITSNVGINGIPDINAALNIYGDLKLQNNGTVSLYTSNGNFGINSPNPNYTLQVNGTTQVAGNLLVNNGAIIKGVTIRKSNGSIPNIGTYIPGIGMSNDNLGVNILTNNVTASQYIKFSTSNIEVARFTGTGNFGIGISNPTYKLQLGTDSAAKPSTSTWTVTSDERLKENIENANLDICYSNIKNIPLRRFTWNSNYYTDEHIDDRTKVGWVAQEVEKVFKKAVKIHDLHGISDCKTLNADQIYTNVFGAVQKLQFLVEEMMTSQTKSSSKINQFSSKSDSIALMESKIISLEKTIKEMKKENIELKAVVDELIPKNVITMVNN
jgi:hypothetical protein